ncbi:MAG TPA: precorrin-2 C(20)-methyltransferase [Streptosporangiaceae bacterium]|nr:precorrin-2 C(20)-methyltransferase [Streptosporangiaceae bacterium]
MSGGPAAGALRRPLPQPGHRAAGTPAGPVLVGVGVGPGDPELVTVKAVRVLREADLVLVPAPARRRGRPGDQDGEQGRAEATVRAHAGHDRIRRVAVALAERGGRCREAAWNGAAAEVARAFGDGAGVVAFATIGDPNVYSTFTYLAAAVRASLPGVGIATVPGITAMQDLAARSGTVLCQGQETLALLPLTAGVPAFAAALAAHDTVVGYKSGRRLPEALAAVRAAGRLDGAVHGACLGLPGEDIRPAAEVDGPAPYLSALLVPAGRRGRGGRP